MRYPNGTSKLIPIFYNRYDVPFVFWNSDSWAVIIQHCEHLYLIVFATWNESPPRDSVFYKELPEVFLRDYRGRVIASYNQKNWTLIVKRDGRILEFGVPGKPIQYYECKGERKNELLRSIDICNDRYHVNNY